MVKAEMSTDSNVTAPIAPSEVFGYLEEPKEGWMIQETFQEKFKRKVLQNPLVPLGLGVTIGALTYGLYQMKTGDRRMSQKMMRLRVAAQGFTVAALLGGIVYQSQMKKKEKQS